MTTARKFLVIDDNPEGRFLLTKTLLRKFPLSLAVECSSAGTAVTAAGQEKPDAIIVHRSDETSGVDLVTLMRKVAPDVPIVLVSGFDRTQEALAAGANRFLNYDEWLRIGSVVEEILGVATSKPPFSARELDANPKA